MIGASHPRGVSRSRDSQDQQRLQDKNRVGTGTWGNVKKSINMFERTLSEPQPEQTTINEIQGGDSLYPTKVLAAISKSLGDLRYPAPFEPPCDPLVPPPQYAIPVVHNSRPKKPLPNPRRSDYVLLQNFFKLPTPPGEGEARRLASLRNNEGMTPLHAAARAGRAFECGALLRLGAPLEAVDTWGYTAVHKGAAGNSVKVLETLDRFGANLEARGDHDYLPLHRAAANGCVDAVRWLLERCGPGAVDRKAQGGWSALHLAVWWDHIEVVKVLLGHGANEKAITDDGSSVLKIAEELGHTDIKNLILVVRRM